MKKYGDNEQVEVFVGREAEVVNQHLQRVAKPVSEFSDEEKEALQADLEKVRAEQSPQEEAVQPEEKPTSESRSKGAKSQVKTDE